MISTTENSLIHNNADDHVHAFNGEGGPCFRCNKTKAQLEPQPTNVPASQAGETPQRINKNVKSSRIKPNTARTK